MFKLMGSTYFFSSYKDFKSKDTDYWELIDPKGFFKYVRRLTTVGQPMIEYFSFNKNVTKEDHILEALNNSLPLVVGKFLIPEFCQEIGLNIQDLPRLKPLIDNLDEKHLYEKVIYEAYLENGDFYLTNTQRDQAYEIYKKARNQ